MQAQIDEKDYGADDADEEQGAGGSRGGFEFAGRCAGFAGNCVRVRFEEYEAETGDDRGACGVEEALQEVEAEHVGDGQALFAREQQRADRFAGAAEEENRGEASKRQAVDRPEIRWAEIGLKYLPAGGAQGVTGVNADEREDEVVRICVVRDAPKLGAAEAR